MIIPIYKKIGESTHMLAKAMGDQLKTKATHSGTLDPMAEGVIVVLTHDDLASKIRTIDWRKTYQFDMLLGLTTDSLDLLGLNTDIIKLKDIKKIDKKNITNTKNNIAKILPKFTGKIRQKQPKFSAQRIDGKSGFDLAKKNIKFEVTENVIDIYTLKLKSHYFLSLKELEKTIPEKISKIKGDFRQKKIIKDWKKVFKELKKLDITKLPIIKFEAQVSKRTYIRALVRDIGAMLKIPATTFSITRTLEGPYSQKECK